MGLLLDGQPRPHLNGGKFPALPNVGVRSIYAYIPYRRTTKFDVVTRVEGRVSWGQPRLPYQVSGVSALPILGISPAFMPTPFNAERPNTAW